MNRKNIGSTFDSWLREEGLYGEVRAAAVHRVIARKLNEGCPEAGRSSSGGVRGFRTGSGPGTRSGRSFGRS
jgi:antitoxin HicB